MGLPHKELLLAGSNGLTIRSQWPRGLRRRSSATHLLKLRVRIPPGEWMSFCCECCVLSGRGLCDELITRPEESYRLWCVVMCNVETSWMRRPWSTGGCCVLPPPKWTTRLKCSCDLSQGRKSYCRVFVKGWSSKILRGSDECLCKDTY